MTLRGHEGIFDRFLKAMAAGRVHHAWLLAGAGGVGKATLADAMAAAYLCERNREAGGARPACGECHACRMRLAGAHPDMRRVVRIEEKRDISIAQVRELLGFLSMSGAQGARRVALLDGAELMNPQAANALLKGLEEPSPGSLMLIVCGDMARLPATVRSRCALERCAPLSGEETASVLDGQGLEARFRPLALELAAGRPGRVQALLDPAVAEALLEWRELVADLATADVGRLSDWMSANLARVPRELVVEVVLTALEPKLSRPPSFAAAEAVAEAAWAVAGWPRRVVRHTLRPAPTLLAHLMQLRLALRGG